MKSDAQDPDPRRLHRGGSACRGVRQERRSAAVCAQPPRTRHRSGAGSGTIQAEPPTPLVTDVPPVAPASPSDPASTAADTSAPPPAQIVDATALTSPISVSFAWVEADAQPTLQLKLVGANKKKITNQVFQFGREDAGGPGWAGPVQKGAIKPAGKGPILFEQKLWWAGAGDNFRVVKDGDAIVVKDRTEDEQVPLRPGDEKIYTDVIRVTLAPGAKVKAVAASVVQGTHSSRHPKSPKEGQ